MKSIGRMVNIEEAERILDEWPRQPVEEEIPLAAVLGRILARDIASPFDMPPFDRSAMDGYAVFSGDRSEKFRVAAALAAGDVPPAPLKEGECVRIMTGAMLPAGADRVVRREIAVEQEGFMRITGEDPADNIRRKGEDLAAGQILLPRGSPVRSREMAILASAGLGIIPVYKRPVTGIATTGSELLEPGTPLREGLIYNSNAVSLGAQIGEVGAESRFFGTVPDEEEALLSSLESFFQNCDLLILSGGVSAGDYDYVPQALRSAGFRLHFEKIAVQPGMPTVFGTRDEKVVFGLPGNPVSTFVIFEILIKPFLFRMMGHEYKPFFIRGTLEEDYRRKNAARTAFIPVLYNAGKVRIIPYHGSAHLLALHSANALISVPRGVLEIPAGSVLDVRQI
jgi:molybdopterin molybdotransferase